MEMENPSSLTVSHDEDEEDVDEEEEDDEVPGVVPVVPVPELRLERKTAKPMPMATTSTPPMIQGAGLRLCCCAYGGMYAGGGAVGIGLPPDVGIPCIISVGAELLPL
jgi:hypothetical protein